MLLAILLTIYAIVFISALIYIIACLVAKRELSTRKKYQEHIRGHLPVDDLVTELSPSSIPVPNESDSQYQEAKRKMVADIRTYFNKRKNDATLAKKQRPDELAPVNQSARSYEDLTFPTPPSIEIE